MDSWTQYLNHNPGPTLVGLVACVIVLAAFCLVQALALRSLRARWGNLMKDSEGQNLEELLQRHLTEREHLDATMSDSVERLEVLERKIRSAKRYVGLVKYDAFEDVGGSQSFSMAVYDEEGNGVVLSSLVGREGCRVYGKSLTNGKSERHLSTEEEMAIEQATSTRSRPRISP